MVKDMMVAYESCACVRMCPFARDPCNCVRPYPSRKRSGLRPTCCMTRLKMEGAETRSCGAWRPGVLEGSIGRTSSAMQRGTTSGCGMQTTGS
eukprot:3779930-Alexandrium_andersonii.AAC.1